MRLGSLFILLLLLYSCEKKEKFYEYLTVQNSDIKLWSIPFPEKRTGNIENGDWFIKTPENDTIAQGKFVNGLRQGLWNYRSSNTQEFEINWKEFENEEVNINHPNGWKVYETPGRPFQAGLPSPENQDDKYFIILSYNKDSIKMDLSDYWALYNTKTFEKDSVKSYIQYRFEQGESKFYYSEYTLVREGEENLVFNFLGELDSNIYDITFSSLNIKDKEKRIVFFEMIRGLNIKQHRFFSPFYKMSKIQEVRFALPAKKRDNKTA